MDLEQLWHQPHIGLRCHECEWVDGTGQFVTLSGFFVYLENLVWVSVGVSKATAAIHRRVQSVVDSFITGRGKPLCNTFLFLCAVTPPDAQGQEVGRGHNSRVTPLLSSRSSCLPPPHPTDFQSLRANY